VKGIKPVRIEKTTFAIDGLTPGQYLLEWWDTYNGSVLTESRRATDARGSLKLEAPAFTRDLAGKLRLVEERREGEEKGGGK